VSGYVLDASVAAKWFLPRRHETLVDESLLILERFTAGHIGLSVPDLFWPEMGNILWKSVRLGRMSTESADRAIELLAGLKIPTSSSLPLLRDAFVIAVTSRRTVYDSMYVALAVASGRLLVTADERLANALGAYFPVRWLGAV
jgi:predicted nucleic acid-binding protein